MNQTAFTMNFNLFLIADYQQRIAYHYDQWFFQVSEKFGKPIAVELESVVKVKAEAIKISRFSKIFEFNQHVDLDIQISNLSDIQLIDLRKAMALNWLANDGVWFQEVESRFGMNDAKFCNDEAWRMFSPFEANQIINLIKLPRYSGLDGLKKALQYRLYADINKQSIGNEKDSSFDFYMNECRVQIARNRKGMPDYPCKSAGIIEYSTFAQTIDSRIQTEVIACPPDNHPIEWFCGWHFKL